MSLENIAKSLTVGASLASQVLTAACVVSGTLLILTAYTNYKIHRRNPKLVPLTTPICYIIFGVVLVFIPFLGDLLKIESGDPNPAYKKEQYYEDAEEEYDEDDDEDGYEET